MSIDYSVATDTSVVIVCSRKLYRRRVWKMLIDDEKLGLKSGDLVISDPLSCRRFCRVDEFLIVDRIACSSGVSAEAGANNGR